MSAGPDTGPAQAKLTVEQIEAEMADFEAKFPPPQFVSRMRGGGYCVTAYGAWDADKFCGRWDGWVARARRARTLLEAKLQRVDDLTRELAQCKRERDELQAQLDARAEVASMGTALGQVAAARQAPKVPTLPSVDKAKALAPLLAGMAARLRDPFNLHIKPVVDLQTVRMAAELCLRIIEQDDKP